MFNPKITDFLKDNKDVTILGLWWSMLWRFYVALFGIYLALILLVVILSALMLV